MEKSSDATEPEMRERDTAMTPEVSPNRHTIPSKVELGTEAWPLLNNRDLPDGMLAPLSLPGFGILDDRFGGVMTCWGGTGFSFSAAH